jgi:hypothetical protein
MSNDFDLHAVLTGRKYPTGTVRVWFDEEDWYELAALESRHASLKAEDPELKAVEREIQEAQKRIDETAFTVHLRGISPRAGEDLISKALAEYPIKRDLYGREEDERARLRNQHVAALSFAAHIVKVVSPAGTEVVLTDENRLEQAKLILGEAPPSAIDRIDKGIAAVSKNFAELQAKQASPDFS